jgi:ferric-dicitrate binding protein FerR (iron transport regulator)
VNNGEDRSGDGAHEDEAVARLLAATGARPQPSDEARARVRAAVEAEWRARRPAVAQAETRSRPGRLRSLTTGWALAAAMVASLGLVWLMQARGPSAVQVAAIERVDGTVQLQRGRRGDAVAMVAGQPLLAGDRIQTGERGRLVLRSAAGIELRLDHDSRLAWAAPDAVRLTAGAAYVDADAAGATTSRLVIETPAGEVRHLGTRYQVRVLERGIEVAVREGRVRVDSGHEPVIGRAGERLTVANGLVSRTTIAATATEWQWAELLAGSFAIEGRSLQEFLHWVERETGREVVFRSEAAREAAERTVLRGSVDGLTPSAAIEAVLPTTGLEWRTEDERLLIGAPGNRVD